MVMMKLAQVTFDVGGKKGTRSQDDDAFPYNDVVESKRRQGIGNGNSVTRGDSVSKMEWEIDSNGGQKRVALR